MFGTEGGHFGDGLGVRRRGGPGAGAAGEDLEAVGAEFDGFGGGVVERARGGSVDADAAGLGFGHLWQDSAWVPV